MMSVHDPLDRLRADFAKFKDQLNSSLDQLSGPMCEEGAAMIAQVFVKLDRWQTFYDKWGSQKEMLDKAFDEADDVVAEYLADILSVFGVEEGEPE